MDRFRFPSFSALIFAFSVLVVSTVLAGCDGSRDSGTGKDFVEFNGVRNAINEYDITGGYSEVLKQQKVELRLFAREKTIGTLSLRLEGNPARVVGAGFCIVYGNGIFQHGGRSGALCTSGPSVVSAIDWNSQSADSPRIEFKWNGTIGKESIPARVEFSSATVTRK
jgi:predicted small secreted protein